MNSFPNQVTLAIAIICRSLPKLKLMGVGMPHISGTLWNITVHSLTIARCPDWWWACNGIQSLSFHLLPSKWLNNECFFLLTAGAKETSCSKDGQTAG